LFTKNGVVVKGPDGGVQIVGVKKGPTTYKLMIKLRISGEVHSAQDGQVTWQLWHQRLGHACLKQVRAVLRSKGITATGSEKFFCEACVYGKMSKGPYKSIRKEECKPGARIHADTSGRISTPSMSGCQYFVSFADESTGFIKVAFIKKKNEVLNAFKKVVQEVKVETGNRVEVLRTDQGTEFISEEFKKFLLENGITHEMSVEYTPQSNGLAERSIRTLTEKARAMILDARLHKSLWAECVYTSAYLSNRLPRADGSVTSFELWHRKPASIEHLRSFACQAYVHVPRQKRAKFDAKAWKGILIGYGPSDKMYRIYDPQRQRVEVVRDVKFNEVNERRNHMIYAEDEVNVYDEDIEENTSTIINEELSEDGQKTPVVRKPGRPKGSKTKKYSTVPLSMSLRNQGTFETTEESDQEINNGQENDNIIYMAMDGPTTFEDALDSDQDNEWVSAMQDELDSLVKNKVFEVTKLPKDKKPRQTGWVLKTKRNPDGTIDRLKARIVAKGYAQKSGLDYNETYAPVVRSASVRVFLGIVAYEDLAMVQCDVMTAFLYGDLEDEIYVRPPEGIELEDTKVWKLKKSLYGLKQSPRCWNTKFDYFLKNFELIRSLADPCIYYSHDKRGRILVALYVDDLLIAGSNNKVINEIVDHLKNEFEIKVFEPNCFVDFELERDRANKTISLSQIGYLRKVLERFNMSNCNQSSTPGEEKSLKKTDETKKTINEVSFPYQQAIGSLLYAAMMTRPDIAFQVRKAARKVQDPSHEDVVAVKRIMRYIKGTLNIRLRIGGGKLILEGFCDSDYAGCYKTAKSTYGNVFLFNNGAVAWESRKSNIVADSTTVAEYQAAFEATKLSIWLRDLIGELSVLEGPTTIWCDNQAAVKLSNSEDHKKRTKHVNVRFHFLREAVKDGTVVLKHVSGLENPADMFTKPLPSVKLKNCCELLNLK